MEGHGTPGPLSLECHGAPRTPGSQDPRAPASGGLPPDPWPGCRPLRVAVSMGSLPVLRGISRGDCLDPRLLLEASAHPQEDSDLGGDVMSPGDPDLPGQGSGHFLPGQCCQDAQLGSGPLPQRPRRLQQRPEGPSTKPGTCVSPLGARRL